jgi:cytoskeletal protein CcmA (bactofilin family)
MALFGKSSDNKKIENGNKGTLDSTGSGTCVISKGTVIEGKFSCSENVRLDGTIVGEVHCDKRFVMGDSGLIKGNLHSKECAIMGTVEGDIFIEEGLQMQPTSRVKGNIKAGSVSIEEGAVLDGDMKVTGRSH